MCYGKDSGYDEEKAYNNAILLALERAKKVVKKLSENE